jgi:hypothetical protein
VRGGWGNNGGSGHRGAAKPCPRQGHEGTASPGAGNRAPAMLPGYCQPRSEASSRQPPIVSGGLQRALGPVMAASALSRFAQFCEIKPHSGRET